jgi:hypothetical protein
MAIQINPSNIKPATTKQPFDLLMAINQGRRFIGETSPERTISENFAYSRAITTAGICLDPTMLAKRAGTLGLTEGAPIIQTTTQPIADVLRPFSAMAAAGATFLTNINGNLSFPRGETTSTPAILNDGDAVTASNQTFPKLTLNAQRVSTQVGISSELLRLATVDVEAFVTSEIMRSVASSVDLMAIIAVLAMTTQTADKRALDKCYAVTLSGAVTHAKTISMKQSVMGASVVNNGTFAWIIDSATLAKWASTSKGATYPEFVLDNDQVLNTSVYVTENLASTHQAIPIRASDVIIPIWAIEVVVDDITKAHLFQTILTVNTLCSAGLLRGPAACVTSDSASQ